ncbi:MAG TPA: ATP-binding protein [Gemmatimonadaceae bacterium]|nr:ATP-binding protein [Gemmatimonadaceae bacterium]
MLDQRRVLRWIYIGRLSLASAIFVAAVLAWQAAEARVTLIASLAVVAAITVTAISRWYESQTRRPTGRAFFYLQAVFDVALVTAVVHVTGGQLSQFAALYILVTAGASLLLPAGGGLLIAALGISCYIADVIISRTGAMDVGMMLQLAVFAGAALGVAYLSARLKEAGTDREELEAQLALARLQAEDILRNIRSGIVTIGAQRRLLFANPAAGALLGFDHETAAGRPVSDAIATVCPALAEALDHALADGERVTRGEAVITQASRSFPIGFTTTILDADGDDASLSATAIFQDITDNKRLEELRLRAERLEGVAELSASLAHEIKNPLASIRSAVEQLARAPRATDDERTLGTLIVRESDRLARLLTEFLDFARVRKTRGDMVDIGEVARTATGLAASHPDCTRGIAVVYQPPREPVYVEGDEDLLHRAIFNITLNAIQASPDNGRVGVEIRSLSRDKVPPGVTFRDGAVALRVTDVGPGIPAAIKDRVFDPFFTTKPGGTGLGLPIVHRAIEAHRGCVLLDTGKRGTRFTVLLPLPQPAGAEAA